jgi:hypothetical protein
LWTDRHTIGSRAETRPLAQAPHGVPWLDAALDARCGIRVLLAAITVPATTLEQAVQVAAGFVLKPAYMALSLALAVLLRRRRERPLVLVRWGLLAFFVGEGACALNYLLGGPPSDALELLHGAGMVVMAALVPWGIFELLDEHVWRFTARDAPCGAIRLCRRCWKQEDVPCAMQRLFLFTIPALAVLAVLPLTSPIAPFDVTVVVFGANVDHVASEAVQRFEFRLLPVAAIVAFAVALALVARGQDGIRAARPWFFGGLGALAFALLRFLLLRAYAPMPVWSDFWEEATELVAILGVAGFLWAVWRPLGFGTAAPAERARA